MNQIEDSSFPAWSKPYLSIATIIARGSFFSSTATGQACAAVVRDHRDDAAVERLFEQIRGEQGRLDERVNNAFLLPEDLDPTLPFWQPPLSNRDDMIDGGVRSADEASVLAAGLRVDQSAMDRSSTSAPWAAATIICTSPTAWVSRVSAESQRMPAGKLPPTESR